MYENSLSGSFLNQRFMTVKAELHNCKKLPHLDEMVEETSGKIQSHWYTLYFPPDSINRKSKLTFGKKKRIEYYVDEKGNITSSDDFICNEPVKIERKHEEVFNDSLECGELEKHLKELQRETIESNISKWGKIKHNEKDYIKILTDIRNYVYPRKRILNEYTTIEATIARPGQGLKDVPITKETFKNSLDIEELRKMLKQLGIETVDSTKIVKCDKSSNTNTPTSLQRSARKECAGNDDLKVRLNLENTYEIVPDILVDNKMDKSISFRDSTENLKPKRRRRVNMCLSVAKMAELKKRTSRSFRRAMLFIINKLK